MNDPNVNSLFFDVPFIHKSQPNDFAIESLPNFIADFQTDQPKSFNNNKTAVHRGMHTSQRLALILMSSHQSDSNSRQFGI